MLGHCETLELLSGNAINSVAQISEDLLVVADRDVGLRWLTRDLAETTVPNTVGAFDVKYRQSDGLVYWTDWGATTDQDGLWRAAPESLDGKERLFSGNASRQLVVDADGVYFIDDGQRAVMAYLDEDGGEETKRIVDEDEVIATIATDGDFVYWSRVDFVGDPIPGVFRAPKRTPSGGVQVSGVSARSLLVADGYLYITEGGDSDVFSDCLGVGSVLRIAVTSGGVGSAETLADQEACPRNLAVDADYVYWTLHELGPGGAIRRSPRHCDPEPSTVAFGLALPMALNVGADAIFFVEDDKPERRVTLTTKRPDP
ncbi:MAG: hypothetical protein JRH11_18895 [Deltaproteobacteria bacterium]|nr:hypothetical protein [Deltaproteobacteria bacterium]